MCPICPEMPLKQEIKKYPSEAQTEKELWRRAFNVESVFLKRSHIVNWFETGSVVRSVF